MILLIDNYDSFSYNLYQLMGRMEQDMKKQEGRAVSGSEIRVIRNDELSIEEIEALHPEGIVLSPGPGRPKDAGVCEEVIRRFSGKVPILGVCLGHQAICEALGGEITYAEELMHGKKKLIVRKGESRILEGLSKTFYAARYHSLVANPKNLPKELLVTAESPEGEIMAVEHEGMPIFGLQFHPESVMTPEGEIMIQNFFRIIQEFRWR